MRLGRAARSGGRNVRAAKPEARGKRTRTDAEGLRAFFGRLAERHPHRTSIAFLCIGTDCSTGDAFGPLLGTRLEELGFPHVAGTLAEPCDASRVGQLAQELPLPRDTVVIALDACLGKPGSAGSYLVAEGPLRPAEALGPALGELGDYSVEAVVNTMGPRPYRTLQTTSLHTVLGMVRAVAEAAAAAWPQHKP